MTHSLNNVFTFRCVKRASVRECYYWFLLRENGTTISQEYSIHLEAHDFETIDEAINDYECNSTETLQTLCTQTGQLKVRKKREITSKKGSGGGGGPPLEELKVCNFADLSREINWPGALRSSLLSPFLYQLTKIKGKRRLCDFV